MKRSPVTIGRRLCLAALGVALGAVSMLLPVYAWGRVDGRRDGLRERRSVPAPRQAAPPTPYPPLHMDCDRGLRIYRTPEGGISTAPGGAVCP